MRESIELSNEELEDIPLARCAVCDCDVDLLDTVDSRWVVLCDGCEQTGPTVGCREVAAQLWDWAQAGIRFGLDIKRRQEREGGR